MIEPEQIPEQAVEAAAQHDHDVRTAAVMRDLGKMLPAWADLSEGAKATCRTHARAFLAAGINAWPGAEIDERMWPTGSDFLILPLKEPHT